MKRLLNNWKFYAFVALACVVLFLLPPNNQAALLAWMVVVYGSISIWIYNHQSEIVKGRPYTPKVVTPVAEFMDEDRLYLQATTAEIPDDSLLDNPHEAI